MQMPAMLQVWQQPYSWLYRPTKGGNLAWVREEICYSDVLHVSHLILNQYQTNACIPNVHI